MDAIARRISASITTATLMVWLCLSSVGTLADGSNTALMQESFQQFDQKLETGWRTLQLKRDYLGAANAIQDYLTVHSSQLQPWQKDSLAFHLGHIYAMADKRPEAVKWLRQSTADHLMSTTAYVDAYIAFLQNDKQSLVSARQTIATTNPGPWRAQQLHEVDSMVDYFGEPFEAAWGALNCNDATTKNSSEAWTKFCAAVKARYPDIYAKHGNK